MITIEAKEQDDFVSISVEDTGIGIDPKELDKIFGLFVQIDHSIQKAQGGLGIGLTVVKNLVEMQRGSVEVESKGLNAGTIFTVRLPMSHARAKSALEEKAQSSSESAYRVLIVDDNEDSAKTLGWMLELLGHTTSLAFNGPMAIKKAKNFQPHLVLLDIGLPEMNGYEVCKILKGEESLKKTVFVAQTGWGNDEHRRLSKGAGFDHHLVKPVGSADLSSIIKTLRF